MKKTKAVSPDVIMNRQNQLIPLKQKYAKTKIREVPGWRTGTSASPQSIYISPSKLCKVKSRKEYYSPLVFAIDNHLPFILPNKSKSESKIKKKLNVEIVSKTQRNLKKTKELVTRSIDKKRFCNDSLPSPTHLKPALSSENISKIEFDLEKLENRSLNVVLKPKVSQFLANKDNPIHSSKTKRRRSACLEKKGNSILYEYQFSDYLKVFRRSKSIDSRKINPESKESSIIINSRIEIKTEETESESETISKDISNNSLSFATHDRKSSFKSSNSKISKDEFTCSYISDSNVFQSGHPRKSITRLFKEAESNLKRSSTLNRAKNSSLINNTADKMLLKDCSKYSISSNGLGTRVKNLNNNPDFIQFNYLDMDERQEDLIDPSPQVRIKNFQIGNEFNFSSASTNNYSSNMKNSGILTAGFNNAGLKYHGHQDFFSKKNASNELILNPSVCTKILRSDTNSSISPKVIKSSLKKSPTINIENPEDPFSKKQVSEKPAKQKILNQKVSFKGIKNSSSSEEEKIKIKIDPDPDSNQRGCFPNDRNDEEKNDTNYLTVKKGKKSELRLRGNSNELMAQEIEKKKKSSKKGSRKFNASNVDEKKRKNKSHNLNELDEENLEENKDGFNFFNFDYYDFYSSDTSNDSIFSSMTGKTFQMKNIKEPSKGVTVARKKIKNLAILRYFKKHAMRDQQKVIGKNSLDPVTNFIFNFSFNILKCIKLIVKMEYSQNDKKVKRQKSFKLMFERNSGSEKTQKKGLVDKNGGRKSLHEAQGNDKKSLPAKNVPPASFSRIEKPLPRCNKTRIEKEDIKLDTKSEQKSEGCSSETSEQSSVSESSKYFPNRKQIIREILRKDLSLQIARQILEVQEEDFQDEFVSSDESCPDQDMQNEIFKFKKKLKNFQNTAFSHEIDFKALKTNQAVFTFKQLEDGCFEVDMENLMRTSAKKMFLEKQKIFEEDQNGKTAEVHMSENEGMTEEQMYKARVEKVKIVGEKLKKRREKLKNNNEIINTVERSNRKSIKAKAESPVIGDSYDERVYLRLKGSSSPNFKKK